MLKKVALFFSAAYVLLIVVVTAMFPPTRWEKHNHQRQTTELYDRHWTLLPPSEWGLLPLKICSREGYGGRSTTLWCFGVFALSETHGAWTPPVEAQQQRDAAGQ